MKKSVRSIKSDLSRKLLARVGGALVVVVLAALGVNYHLIRADLKRQVQERGQSIARGLVFATEGAIDVGHSSILRRVAQNYARLPAVVEIAIVDPDGRILANSADLKQGSNRLYGLARPTLAPAMEQATRQGMEQYFQTRIDNHPVIVQIFPFSSTLFGLSGRRGLAIAILDLEKMQQDAWGIFFTSTLTMLGGVLLILALIALLLQKMVLGPLKRLNQSVFASKATGIFTLPDPNPDNEIGFLASTFDTVFQQRLQVEMALRASEVRERAKSQELETTLQDLKRTQAQLIQSEKMSSLGQLVAGVAHEVNNPVSFIHGNLTYTEQYLHDIMGLLEAYRESCDCSSTLVRQKEAEVDLEFVRDDLPKLISSMKVGATRIRDIVHSLRNFSRLDEAELKSVDIHEGIDTTLMILQNRLKGKPGQSSIQVIKEYSLLPLVECYASQLNQVFLNVLANAIDVLEERNSQHTPAELAANPSKIVIRTEVMELDWVRIRIIDNGPGIIQELQHQLFDPFFTTKPIGQGTGLGLSISHQIVMKAHHGHLHCNSTQGEGAEFVIEIPCWQSVRHLARTVPFNPSSMAKYSSPCHQIA